MIPLCTNLAQVGKFTLLGQGGELQRKLAFANFALLATGIVLEKHESDLKGRCFHITDGLITVLFLNSLRPMLPGRLESLLDIVCDLSWSAGAILTFNEEQNLKTGASLIYALVETSLHAFPMPKEVRMVVGVTAGVVNIWFMWENPDRHGE